MEPFFGLELLTIRRKELIRNAAYFIARTYCQQPLAILGRVTQRTGHFIATNLFHDDPTHPSLLHILPSKCDSNRNSFDPAKALMQKLNENVFHGFHDIFGVYL